jgi:hypothetical protein
LITTLSTPSTSASLTPMTSFFDVGTFLPTKSARNRQLAVPAVDHHRELDRARPADVDQGVHRGAHRASGVEHVVHQHHDLALDVHRDVAVADHRLVRDGGEIVAIERDVETPDHRGLALELCDLLGQALRNRIAAARIPTSTRSSTPLLRSTISWAMRVTILRSRRPRRFPPSP